MDQLDRKGVFNNESSQLYNQEKPEIFGLEDKFAQLHGVQQLQKSILKQNMHNAMSPLSAIWGYLEMIDMSLEQKTDIEKIRYYRNKIESGINEVNDILLQLQRVYSEAELYDQEEEILDVDLNWIIGEICKELPPQRSKIKLITKPKPIHVKADLYIIKLVIFKLISFSTKCTVKNSNIELNTSNDGSMALFSSTFQIAESKKDEIIKVMEASKSTDKSDFSTQSPAYEGLEVSVQLVKQMGGEIDFLTTDDCKATLCLTIPLSYPV